MNEPRIGTPYAAGFSLLETLVALLILAVSLGAILGIFATALRAASQADDITRATRIGESLLAQLGTEIPLHDGISQGTLPPGYRWRISVAAYTSGTELPSWQMPLQAYWVEIEVARTTGGPGATVKLSTLRLAGTAEIRL